MILGGKDITRAPTDISSEVFKSLDKDGGLDGHVKRSRNTGASKDLGSSVLGSACHKSRHLNLSELNILATVVGEGNISNYRTSLEKNKQELQNVSYCISLISIELLLQTLIHTNLCNLQWTWLFILSIYCLIRICLDSKIWGQL